MANDDALVEALAALAHEQWSGWMTYMLGRFHIHTYSDSNELWGVDAQDAQRWHRQMKTSYADLSEPEKESDRAEARRVLAVLASERERAAQAARKRVYIILAGVLDSLDQAEHLTNRIMALVASKEDAR